jgi:transcriptional regulator GlxA family with amidase domain
MKVGVVIFEGFEELDALGPYAVLRYAARAGADLTAELVTLDQSERVTAAHGLTLEPQGILDDSYDMVLVPGGGWQSGAPGGARAEAERGELPDALRRLYRRGTAMASVCTGAMLLAAAGVTAGRPATTNRGVLDELAGAGAEVVRERVVDDGDLITAGGVTAGIDLALWLVERDFGRELADGIARGMEYERTGGVWRRDSPPQTGAE